MQWRRLAVTAIGSLALAITTMGCSDETESDETQSNDSKLTVAAAFYPIEELLLRVGGSNIAVSRFVAPGEEAHEFEPTAQQVAALERADVVFYLGSGFQPSLESAIMELPDSVRRVDLMIGLTVLTGDDGIDPHVWLDPRNMQMMAQTVAEILSEEASAQAAAFTAAAQAFVEELDALSSEFEVGLQNCAVPVVVSTHRAFAYLAEAYGLTHRAIAGASPGDEPSAKSLEEVAQFAADNGVTTIFFESELRELAETVADEIDAATALLATGESLTSSQLNAGDSYSSVMRDNLEALRLGMNCT